MKNPYFYKHFHGFFMKKPVLLLLQPFKKQVHQKVENPLHHWKKIKS